MLELNFALKLWPAGALPNTLRTQAGSLPRTGLALALRVAAVRYTCFISAMASSSGSSEKVKACISASRSRA
jgi:hypothetical protein